MACVRLRQGGIVCDCRLEWFGGSTLGCIIKSEFCFLQSFSLWCEASTAGQRGLHVEVSTEAMLTSG